LNFVSKANEIQQLMSKSAIPLRRVVNRFSGDLHVRHGVPPSTSSMTCVDNQEPAL
jgi:hypothetical protein